MDNNQSLNNLQMKEEELEIQKQNNKILQALIDTIGKYYEAKLLKIDAPKVKLSLIVFSVLVLTIILISGGLVLYNKMDSTSFTFLLGTIIGSMITFLGKQIISGD